MRVESLSAKNAESAERKGEKLIFTYNKKMAEAERWETSANSASLHLCVKKTIG